MYFNRKKKKKNLMDIIDPEVGSKWKRLYSYVNSLRHDASGVSPLKDKQGIPQNDLTIQVNLPNTLPQCSPATVMRTLSIFEIELTELSRHDMAVAGCSCKKNLPRKTCLL